MVSVLRIRKDGGPQSNVTGYWLIEWKAVFSIALLRFSAGSRENFHNHAFNALSWVLWGCALEEIKGGTWRSLRPRLFPYYTSRQCLHRVWGMAPTTWALTFRGPWSKTWNEVTPTGEVITLKHGREVVYG